MDPLTDLLQHAGLCRRLLDQQPITPSRALRFPCEKSIGLHIATRGPVYVHAPGLDTPLQLLTGDIAVMARGCEHVLSATPSLDGVAVELIGPPGRTRQPPQADECAVISGAYQFWNAPVHPFFGQMPGWFVLRAGERASLGPLALAVGLLEAELPRRELGADFALHGLLDTVFTFALRELVQAMGEQGAGWGHAVRDPQVRRAVALLHEEPAHPWTLESLAARAGLSRTVLAERFREAMGDTPLAYLRTLRMQRAMRLLSETDRHLEGVATAVGYTDAFSFSKVFKRTVGLSPREFRARDAAERQHPYRFGAAG